MATTQSLARLEREVSLQSAVIGFTGDFWMFALIALAALPLLLFVRKPKQPQGAADRAEAMVIAE
jgi:DHA2 family multidrug resistance protein